LDSKEKEKQTSYLHNKHKFLRSRVVVSYFKTQVVHI